jgi:predicted dehydrogenase
MTSTSSHTDAIPVALIGYGLAGAVFHAPLIAATPGLALDTVVTGDPGRAGQARAEHDGVRIAARVEEVWAEAGRYGLVVVASPNRTHVAFARAALEAGIAVVVDKPMAATAGEVRELDALAEERGLLLSAFHNRRWDGDFRTAAALLASGELGEARRFESRFERWRPSLKGGWRESGDPAEAGGLLFDLGSHLVDQALTLLGPARRVYAELDARRPGAAVDDDAFVALVHEGGARSHLWMSATDPLPAPRLRLLGSAAGYETYGLDGQEDALRGGARPGPGWGAVPESAWGRVGAGDELRPAPTLPGDYPAYYAAVAAALRDGTPPPVTAAEAAAVIEVLEAARRSAASGTTVELPTR